MILQRLIGTLLLCLPVACSHPVPSADTAAAENGAQDVAADELQIPEVKESSVAETQNACGKNAAPLLSAESLLFVGVQPGKNQEQSLVVTNGGDCVLHLWLTIDGSERFALTAAGQAIPNTELLKVTLAAHENAEIFVKFSPPTAAADSATLQIQSGDKILAVPLSGNTAACIEILPTQGLDLGPSIIGETHSGQLSVSNCGKTTVQLNDVKLTESNPFFSFDFHKMKEDNDLPCHGLNAVTGPSVDTSCPLAPGQSAHFDVIFAPKYEPVADPSPLTVTVAVSGSGAAKASLPVMAVLHKIKCTEQSAKVSPQTPVLLGSQVLLLAGHCPMDTKAQALWQIQTAPVGCLTDKIDDATSIDTKFSPKCVGTYKLCAQVGCDNAPAVCGATCVQIDVLPPLDIVVDLQWDTPNDFNPLDDIGADLDLHFAQLPTAQPDLDCDGKPDPWFEKDYDCDWFNLKPNWGDWQEAADDDPVHQGDDLYDPGLESVQYHHSQKTGTYAIGVHYWNDFGLGKSLATVQVFIQGFLVLKIADVPLKALDMWYVGNINWPIQPPAGPLPTVELCMQSGDACLAKKDPNSPKGGKMWQKTGDYCVTPCYEAAGFVGKGVGSPSANCKP